MSDPKDIGDFTLKQLLHLYKLSELEQTNRLEKRPPGKDSDLFASIMAGTNPTEIQPSNTAKANDSLTDILDELISRIDSDE
jgi:hypothetical protein